MIAIPIRYGQRSVTTYARTVVNRSTKEVTTVSVVLATKGGMMSCYNRLIQLYMGDINATIIPK